MISETNLYESLYADADENDFELDMINQIFQHLNFDEISSRIINKVCSVLNNRPTDV